MCIDTEVRVVLFGTEAVIEVLKETGQYDEVMCSRIRAVLVAPHKHKGREAHKAQPPGNSSLSPIKHCQHFCHVRFQST